MKLLFRLSILIFFSSLSFTYAQIGINTQTPDPSSAFDITSSSGGILIPRLTNSQKNNISNPATGLMIYQIDLTPGFYFYNGTSWEQLITSVNLLVTSSKIVDGTITSSDLSSGIDAIKIGSGSVTDTEFGYIDGLTSSAQTQITGLGTDITTNTTAISANTSSITTLSSTISNLTDSDTTYSSGTGLTLNGTTFSIDSSVVTSTYTGGVTINGTVTATKFVGDGSGLTGVNSIGLNGFLNYNGKIVSSSFLISNGDVRGTLNPTTITNGGTPMAPIVVPPGKIYNIKHLFIYKTGTRHKSNFYVDGYPLWGESGEGGVTPGEVDFWLHEGQQLSMSYGEWDGYNGSFGDRWYVLIHIFDKN